MKKWFALVLCLLMLTSTALAADTIDGGADQASAVIIAVGGSYLDAIDAETSEWFVFTADQDNAYYRAKVKNEEADAWLRMAIYDEQNIKLFEDDVYKGKTLSYSWKAVPGAKYYIRTWFDSKKASGRMTLSVEKTPDEHGNDLTAASVLAMDIETVSTLDGTKDVDVFTFTTAEDSNYYRLDFKNNDLNAWMNYELLDADGLSVAKDDVYTGKSAYISWKAVPGAQYYVKLYSGSEKECGKYTVKLSCKADNEPNTMADGVVLTDGQKLDGSFDGTKDVDWFTFTTAEGSNYYRLDFKNNDLNAWMNYELLDADGLSVAKDDVYTGKSAYISWKAVPGAQYYVKLYSGSEKERGKYTVTLSHAADNEPDTMENAIVLTAGEKSASFDGSKDTDYFTFTAGEERAYYRLLIKNGTVDTTAYMEHQDAAGLKIKTIEANKGKTGAYSFLAEKGAQYFLKLTRNDGNKLGDYVITIEEYPDPMGDTANDALNLAAGEKVNGTIAGKEDIDFLAVTAKNEDAMVRLTIANAPENAQMNAAVLDAAGKELTSWRTDAGKTSETIVEMAAGTTYYVRIKSDKVGSYTIAREDLKDLGGSDVATAYAAQAGVMDELAFEKKGDIDFVAFPEAGASILVMASGEKNVNVAVIDENGMTIQSETRVYSGNSKLFTADRKGAYLKLTGDGGAYRVQCCTENHHVSSEYYVKVKAPSCSAEGLNEMYCVVCGAVVASETIEKTAHTPYDNWQVTKYASCDDAGEEVKTCRQCGEIVETQLIAATGHQRTSWQITLKDTCTENGIQQRVCNDCGKLMEQEIIVALGHVSGDWTVKKYPTCAESGHQTRTCRVCNTVLEEQFAPALGHQYGEWTVIKEPTSSAEGLQQKVCQNCGDTQEEIIEKKGFLGGIFGK